MDNNIYENDYDNQITSPNEMKKISSVYSKIIKIELQSRGFSEQVEVYEYMGDFHQKEYWIKDTLNDNIKTLTKMKGRYYWNIIKKYLEQEKEQNNIRKRNQPKIPNVLARNKKKYRHLV